MRIYPAHKINNKILGAKFFFEKAVLSGICRNYSFRRPFGIPEKFFRKVSRSLLLYLFSLLSGNYGQGPDNNQYSFYFCISYFGINFICRSCFQK